MTTVRLAMPHGGLMGEGQAGQISLGRKERRWPAILVSYVYLERFLTCKDRLGFRDWIMDSGAYSAWNSGKVIVLNDYIHACKALLAQHKDLKEIIALDVIGSDKGSLVNAQRMRAAGLNVIPVFHVGDDWGIFREYLSGWDKVGLSCRFGEPLKESFRFYDNCFARGWPKKFHSFGWIAEDVLIRYPFHSGDSSSWEMGPTAFGTWKKFGKASVRGSRQNLRTQVEWYLDLEERVQYRWAKQMKQLEATGPEVRLAFSRTGSLER